jgi:Spy/CpxP family protein refolding chaperone
MFKKLALLAAALTLTLPAFAQGTAAAPAANPPAASADAKPVKKHAKKHHKKAATSTDSTAPK